MSDLTEDCAACDGLCCVAPAFDAGRMFAFDKPAETPCRHLGDGSLCRIHDQLAEAGMGGCALFGCKGAGQRTMARFAGRSWRDGPQAARAIFDAFADLRAVHDALELLVAAERLPLAPAEEVARQAHVDTLSGEGDTGALHAASVQARAFLRGLAPGLSQSLTPGGAGGTWPR
ncbi:hypothetical protein [Wenxinia saemankumensis]|uniref:Pentapeptide repeat-containing protein n=1 Tax=Wenxinia saemankumensis TaxID=1447782 RepID=A0A1M6C9W9_9RHOB|nr:hypothetical protein [Wenxinia saemankumensis]SHI57574.1 hypothetical protein SAMN05444417_1077 [Wenxinia saemankumensis]